MSNDCRVRESATEFVFRYSCRKLPMAAFQTLHGTAAAIKSLSFMELREQ